MKASKDRHASGCDLAENSQIRFVVHQALWCLVRASAKDTSEVATAHACHLERSREISASPAALVRSVRDARVWASVLGGGPGRDLSTALEMTRVSEWWNGERLNSKRGTGSFAFGSG